MATRKTDNWKISSHPSPLIPNPLPKSRVRLQKVIADSGLTSRRKAEALIAQGRVTVNGRVVTELGTRVDQGHDHIKVNGRHLKPEPPQTFLILNKPQGYMSSLTDPVGRPTITDLLAGVRIRVFPVGRLDYDSEGLILLTNQGEIAQALLHPRYHVAKTYLVKVKGQLIDEELEALKRGVKLDDGPTAPAAVRWVAKAPQNSWLELTIYEGRKHQVKRMLESVGHPVLRLRRIRFGPLSLDNLPLGRYRYLTDQEANAVRGVVRSRTRAPARGTRSGIHAKGREARGNGLGRRVQNQKGKRRREGAIR